MNIIFQIILFSILYFGCGNISKPLAKGSLNSDKMIIEVSKNEVELRPNEGLVYHDDQPFTGRVINTFPSGIKEETTFYIDGRKHGDFQKWFADGKLSYKSSFVNGLPDGISRSWWKNGNLRSEANQVMGKLQGVQTQWYISGAKFKERNLNMGFEEGLQRSWRENGKVYNNYEAKNGRIFGLKRASLCFQLDDEAIQIGK